MLRPLLASSLFLPLLAGCGPIDAAKNLPQIGTYTIESTLDSNGCGYGGLPIPPADERDATIRGYAGGSASFAWESGDRIVGAATSTGTYQFIETNVQQLRAPDTTTNDPGCTVSVRNALTFTIAPVPREPDDAGSDAGQGDGGVATSTLDGQLVIDVVPYGNTNCSALIGGGTGQWLALPCQAKVDVAGTRTAD